MKPMDSIDLTNRKPRRFKGTPAYRIRNIATVAVVAYSLLAGALYMISPASRNIWNVFQLIGSAKKQELEETTPEEFLQKNLMLQAYKSVGARHQPDNEKVVHEKRGN